MLLLSSLALAAAGGDNSIGRDHALRVCADPNNLPFSNRDREGFEDRLAEMIAAGLGRDRITYTWWAQRRGFIRNTLDTGSCDVVMGQPVDSELVLTTEPYYRSTYALVYRKDADYELRSLYSPKLRHLKIGIHFIGDDGNMLPPSRVLTNRGIVRNVVGYSIYGDYRQPNPPARLIEAVANGDIDVAIAWGPFAGYFAERQPVELRVVPLSKPPAISEPFEFPISLGVREDDEALRDELNEILNSKRAEIHALLEEYGVPLPVNSTRQVSLDH